MFKKIALALIACIAAASLATTAEAAGKKGAKKAKGKGEVAQVHPMAFTCGLNALVRAKQPKACGG